MRTRNAIFAGFLAVLLHYLPATDGSISTDTNQGGRIDIAESFMYRPNLNSAEGKEQLIAMRKFRKNMRAEMKQDMVKQITFDENGDILPGQKVCLPIMSQRAISSMKIDGLPHGVATHPSLDPNVYIIRTIRSIINGKFESRIADEMNNTKVPKPAKHWRVDYRHENHSFIDLGHDFQLNDESFTIVALIRLRPKSGEPIRGARLLSKRSSDNKGWEFVVPSYYGQTISFYANTVPGHIDYGKSSLPENTWTAVGLIFDRHSYADNVALITPYIDGYPDGKGTFMEVEGNLTSVAPLTVGHWRDETEALSRGRRDYRLPGFPRFHPHFQGDIRDIFIWREALDKQQMRIQARMLLKEMGRKPDPCPNGYQELDCRCYQVFNDMKTYASAEARCEEKGGTLAMPKTGRIQDFLEILMQQSERLSFWIGLDDRVTERRKFWADGTELLYDRRKKQTDYNRFPNSKPDKQYHTEDCVEEVKISREFTWNDENCIKLNAYICEVKNTRQTCESSVTKKKAKAPVAS